VGVHAARFFATHTAKASLILFYRAGKIEPEFDIARSRNAN
jgi:hypothetical protein